MSRITFRFNEKEGPEPKTDKESGACSHSYCQHIPSTPFISVVHIFRRDRQF